MIVGARVQSHTSKLKKETNDDIFRSLQKTGNPAGNRLMISNFNIIKKYGQKVSKQGGVDYYKQIDSDNKL